MKKIILTTGALAAAATAAWLILTESNPDLASPDAGAEKPSVKAIASARPTAARIRPADRPAPAVAETAGEDEPEAEESETKSPEDLKAEEDEKLVESFDALTDKWMEPSPKGVSMEDVDRFVREFARLPKDRREECLQRALNLIPDENVMLLAGVLMDKTQPKEFTELIFNDVLNRDEDVKKPILSQIYRDKSHPCWADTAWILDVTGEKPATGK